MLDATPETTYELTEAQRALLLNNSLSWEARGIAVYLMLLDEQVATIGELEDATKQAGRLWDFALEHVLEAVGDLEEEGVVKTYQDLKRGESFGSWNKTCCLLPPYTGEEEEEP